jgi:hypothetical protein
MLMPGNGGKGGNGSRRWKPPACEAVAAPINMAESRSNFFIQ